MFLRNYADQERRRNWLRTPGRGRNPQETVGLLFRRALCVTAEFRNKLFDGVAALRYSVVTDMRNGEGNGREDHSARTAKRRGREIDLGYTHGSRAGSQGKVYRHH